MIREGGGVAMRTHIVSAVLPRDEDVEENLWNSFMIGFVLNRKRSTAQCTYSFASVLNDLLKLSSETGKKQY